MTAQWIKYIHAGVVGEIVGSVWVVLASVVAPEVVPYNSNNNINITININPTITIIRTATMHKNV